MPNTHARSSKKLHNYPARRLFSRQPAKVFGCAKSGIWLDFLSLLASFREGEE
jgi:hypothetical protein